MFTHDQKIMSMFDMALSFLYDSQLSDALSMVQKRIMYKRGEQDGRSAAEWTFNPGPDGEEARTILQGIMDGDPEYMDQLPSPRLGGEYADDPTFRDIVMEELDIDTDIMMEDAHWLAEYEAGFAQAAEDSIRNTLQARVNEFDLQKLAEANHADD